MFGFSKVPRQLAEGLRQGSLLGTLRLEEWLRSSERVPLFKTTRPDHEPWTGRVEELRGKHEESNFLKLEIPIVLVKNDKGAKHIVINSTRFPYFLDLTEPDVEALKQAGLMEKSIPTTIPKPRINYSTLATEYKEKIESGECTNRAELARSLGVSRAWVTMVLNK